MAAEGTSNLFFNRDTKVYAVQGAFAWEIPVLSGYSFSQATNSSQVTLSEMSDATGTSRRGQRAFSDSLAPAEWSFDCYARPTLVSSVQRTVEEVLWANLASKSNYVPPISLASGSTLTFSSTTATLTYATPKSGVKAFNVGDTVIVDGIGTVTGANGTWVVNTSTVATGTGTITFTTPTALTGVPTYTGATLRSAGVTASSTALDFDFTNSNKSSLGTFDLYFVLGATKYNNTTGSVPHKYPDLADTTIYKIEGAVVNEATLNFDVEGITTISWSGMGAKISEVAALNLVDDATLPAVSATLETNIIKASSNLIRNRLTSLVLSGALVGVASGVTKTYNAVLTGGSITISNNISFLTPESLGIVNIPLGHVTGTRSVSGNFTCYLDEKTDGPIDLYQNLLTASSMITNAFNLELFIGGQNAAGTHPTGPGIMFDMNTCHLELPNISNDDVIAMEVNFTALPSTIAGVDELAKIRYVGV